MARWADEWNFFAPDATPDAFRERHSLLAELCGEIGRDPEEIEVSVQLRYLGDPQLAADTAARFIDAGADHIVVTSFPPISPDVVPAIGAALAAIDG